MSVAIILSVPSPDPCDAAPVVVSIDARPDVVQIDAVGLPGHTDTRRVTLTRAGAGIVDAAITVDGRTVDVRGRLDLTTPQGWILSGVAWSVLVADAVRGAICEVWGDL
jgi:hypothetical protein